MIDPQHYPWPPASATGVGSFPGLDPAEAARIVLGELPLLPHLPELPQRGPGAQVVGRGCAALVDFPVELWPSGWRVAGRPGRDLWRAQSLVSADLDALEEHAQGFQGPLKVQLAGVWTLAAGVELRNGERLVSDAGAVADLCASYCEGLQAHAAAVQARVPGARLLFQVDEPALPAVLDGRLPTASGLSTIPAVDRVMVEQRLREVFAAVDDARCVAVAHCCADGVPLELLRRSGARVLSLDATLLTEHQDQAIGEAVEAGTGLILGTVPAVDPGDEPPGTMSAPAANVEPVRTLWHRLGFTAEALAAAVVVSPRCGLGQASPAHARAALAACGEAARRLREDPLGE